ncbi:Uncharacterised protein [Mycobacteroides abscessus subsp. abscessus]|nr:Uncharacterised protein [Mycobacteroides abscessus subsp. abscessus]SIN14696.1 Uncharacterised protein [Mycobacteroides abscessus subsp. abscessus]
MAHWEFRILSEVVGDGTEYFVSEVTYDKDGNIKRWTEREEFDALNGHRDESDLRDVITRLHESLVKPVLRVSADGLLE